MKSFFFSLKVTIVVQNNEEITLSEIENNKKDAERYRKIKNNRHTRTALLFVLKIIKDSDFDQSIDELDIRS